MNLPQLLYCVSSRLNQLLEAARQTQNLSIAKTTFKKQVQKLTPELDLGINTVLCDLLKAVNAKY